MLRLFSEVPGYLLTALAAMGLLLFGNFVYVLVRDAQYAVIWVGLSLFAGTMLFRTIRFRQTIWSRDSRIFRLVACLGASIAAAIPPMLLAHRYTDDAQTQIGLLATRLGEYRCEDLPDASRICLNSDSKIRFSFSRRARNVELISGEASFVVRKDSRPFDVVCASMLVHDVGTSFDIYKKDDSARVTVIEGRVRIYAPLSTEQKSKLGNGEVVDAWRGAPEYLKLRQIEYDEKTQTLRDYPALSEQELTHRMAWREGWIYLDDSPLGEVLAEFARYQPATRFEYTDYSLTQLRFGGAAKATDLEDFLKWLERSHHVSHTMTRDTDGTNVITLSQHR